MSPFLFDKNIFPHLYKYKPHKVAEICARPWSLRPGLPSGLTRADTTNLNAWLNGLAAVKPS
jgi:hypothetical protein